MKYLSIILILSLNLISFQTKGQNTPDAMDIIKKVDGNMVSRTSIVESKMVIQGRRKNRTVVSRGYSEGDDKNFTEYLAPAREKGTKMLKLKNKLWIYSPSTDRIIQLSGHMLRQSVMGSDLSYEDMMEDRQLKDIYDAKVIGEEMINERKTWVLELNAKVEDVSYAKRKMWIDQERFVPLKEDLFAKSGELLKRVEMSNFEKTDGRWYPRKMNFKDMLKSGKGTDFIVDKIEFDKKIPPHIFSKASLRK